jgi:hypothetical protein
MFMFHEYRNRRAAEDCLYPMYNVWHNQKCGLSFSAPVNESVQRYVRDSMISIILLISCCPLNLLSDYAPLYVNIVLLS